MVPLCFVLCRTSCGHAHSNTDLFRHLHERHQHSPPRHSQSDVKLSNLQFSLLPPCPLSNPVPLCPHAIPISLACTLRQTALLNSSTHSTPLRDFSPPAQNPTPPPINSLPTHLPIRCLPLTQLSSAHPLRTQTFWLTFTPQPKSLAPAHSASRQATEIRCCIPTVLLARSPACPCPLPTPTRTHDSPHSPTAECPSPPLRSKSGPNLSPAFPSR